MPSDIEEALRRSRLIDAYRPRSDFQQNDYVGRISRAKLAATRARRLQQMLDELAKGDIYMKMAWRPPAERGRS